LHGGKGFDNADQSQYQSDSEFNRFRAHYTDLRFKPRRFCYLTEQKTVNPLRGRNRGADALGFAAVSALAVRTVILWIHALAGAGWTAAAGGFVIAEAAMDSEEDERQSFTQRAAPLINRLGVAAVVVLVVTGAVNLVLADSAQRHSFSGAFLTVLGVKAGLLLAMCAVLAAAFRAERKLNAANAGDAQRASVRLMVFNGAIVAMGGTALILGLWLLGS
jgi:putative copper export protein